MSEAIGQMLPIAIGVAISPFPIVAVVLMLVTPRGKANGLAFLLGWLVGLVIVGAIVLSVASGIDASDDGAPATWVSVLKLVLGLGVLLLGVKQYRGRPREGDAPETPHWMESLDSFTPVKAVGTGLLLSAVNPKNLLLTVAGAATIAQTGIDADEQVIAYAVFVVVASLGVVLPIGAALVMGERSREPLDRLKNWLAGNNAVIMAVLLIVIGEQADRRRDQRLLGGDDEHGDDQRPRTSSTPPRRRDEPDGRDRLLAAVQRAVDGLVAPPADRRERRAEQREDQAEGDVGPVRAVRHLRQDLADRDGEALRAERGAPPGQERPLVGQAGATGGVDAGLLAHRSTAWHRSAAARRSPNHPARVMSRTRPRTTMAREPVHEKEPV